jgi:hypothetical protein
MSTALAIIAALFLLRGIFTPDPQERAADAFWAVLIGIGAIWTR